MARMPSDIAVVSELCDWIAVLYAGRIVESGPTAEVLASPAHPYAMGLRSSGPDIRDPSRRIISIAGAPPSLAPPPAGCAFAERCPFAEPRCRLVPPPAERIGARTVLCQRALEHTALWQQCRQTRSGLMSADPILRIDNVSKTYRMRGRQLEAVRGVSFELLQGRVFGIVGQSGSGKSTLANLLARVDAPTAGGIHFQGQPHDRFRGAALMIFRRSVQMIFQDPFASLNPRFTVGRAVAEPLL